MSKTERAGTWIRLNNQCRPRKITTTPCTAPAFTVRMPFSRGSGPDQNRAVGFVRIICRNNLIAPRLPLARNSRRGLGFRSLGPVGDPPYFHPGCRDVVSVLVRLLSTYCAVPSSRVASGSRHVTLSSRKLESLRFRSSFVIWKYVFDREGLYMTTVKITLPDQLAQEAQRAGLLSQAAMEKLLREQLQTRRRDELFAAMDRMAQTPEPPAMTPEEIAGEIRAAREQRRARSAD